MITCYYYYLIEPLLSEYRDNEEVKPLVSIPVDVKGQQWNISIFANSNQVYMLRLSIPKLTEEKLENRHCEVIQSLKEHVISVLRLAYSSDITLFPRPLWNFIKDGEEPNLAIKITEIQTEKISFNTNNIVSLIANSYQVKHYMRLLSDSLDNRIPLQYRYLSLYKILELKFKTKGKWNNRDLGEVIKKYEADYESLNLSKLSLKNFIHNLRDRCAHIKSNKDVFGITYLSNKDAGLVDKFMPVLRKVTLDIVNKEVTKYGITLLSLNNKKQDGK